MNLTLDELASLTGGRLLGTPPESSREDQVRITEVVVDTREAIGDHSLFIALQGPHFDGHRFVEKAFQRGTALAMVAESSLPTLLEQVPGKPLLVVDDTLEALQRLAARWRQRFTIPLIAITGSNGKTIVKDMLARILSRQFRVFRSPGSYNSQVGVALSLLGLTEDHEIGIIEAGISQTGEMERLEAMIAPTAGIITTIGLAHAAGLGDLETTAREKRKLFVHTPGPLIVDGADPLLEAELFEKDRGPDPSLHVKHVGLVYGEEGSKDPRTIRAPITALKESSPGFEFTLQVPALSLEESSSEVETLEERELKLSLLIPGRHNVSNGAMAAVMAHYLGASTEAIEAGLQEYVLREMRLEMHTTEAGITLINDAYNADPTSLRAALATLKQYGQGHRRIAILGDMLDLGHRSQEAHRQVGRGILQADLDHLITIGNLAAEIAAGAREAGFPDHSIKELPESQDFEALNLYLENFLAPQDVVLFKASRSVGLERAAHRLLESVAPTRLIIDLSALSENFHRLRRALGKETRLMAVVKSFGYGNDSTRVAQTLLNEGVDALAVAYPDEAIPLRRNHVHVPILVTNAMAQEADKLVKYDLQALVYTEEVLEALHIQALRQNKTLGVHLEVDTGMHRAGLQPSDVLSFVQKLQELSTLRFEGLMTHFAAADESTEDGFTALQISRFREAIDALEKAGLRPPLIHAANTAAAWRFPQARFDMVRVGLGLYGLHPSSEVGQRATTKEVLTFTTRILHIHDLPPGESVGYGRTYRTDQTRRLATIAAGYNDGLPRFLSNRGEVLILGQRCPLVGSICMDVAVVDITDLKGSPSVGTEVVLFGSQENETLSIDEWAKKGLTISYELLCNISPRVRRIFRR